MWGRFILTVEEGVTRVEIAFWQMHSIFCSYSYLKFIFKRFIHLFGRVKQKERKRSFIHWYSPQISICIGRERTKLKAGPEAPARSPYGRQGPKHWSRLLLVIPGALAGVLQTVLIWDTGITAGGRKALCPPLEVPFCGQLSRSSEQ